MNYKPLIFRCCVLLSILGVGCQWNLDEVEFPTYNRVQEGLATGNGKLKRGILSLAGGRFLTGGTAPDGRMQLTTWAPEGVHLPVLLDLPPGTVHDLLPLGDGDTSFLVLGTDATQSLLYQVGIGQQPRATRLDRLNRDIDERLGLLQSLQLYDMEAGPGDTYLLTGTVQQTIGSPRLILVQIDADFNTIDVQFFEPNMTGYRVLPYGETQILIAALTADNQLNIRHLAQIGNQTWQRDVAGSRFSRVPGMVLAPERNAVVVAATRVGRNDRDPHLVYIDLTTGKEQDAYAVNLPEGREDAYFVDRLRNGDLLLGGIESPEGGQTSGRHYFLAAVDTTGDLRWFWPHNARSEYISPGFPVSGGQSVDFGTYLFAVETVADTAEAQRILKLDEVGELDNF